MTHLKVNRAIDGSLEGLSHDLGDLCNDTVQVRLLKDSFGVSGEDPASYELVEQPDMFFAKLGLERSVGQMWSQIDVSIVFIRFGASVGDGSEECEDAVVDIGLEGTRGYAVYSEMELKSGECGPFILGGTYRTLWPFRGSFLGTPSKESSCGSKRSGFGRYSCKGQYQPGYAKRGTTRITWTTKWRSCEVATAVLESSLWTSSSSLSDSSSDSKPSKIPWS